jgi:hypothetical protein
MSIFESFLIVTGRLSAIRSRRRVESVARLHQRGLNQIGLVAQGYALDGPDSEPIRKRTREK